MIKNILISLVFLNEWNIYHIFIWPNPVLASTALLSETLIGQNWAHKDDVTGRQQQAEKDRP